MCGIGLVWYRQGVNLEILSKMLLETEKRGSDAFGVTLIREGKVVLIDCFSNTYSVSGFDLDGLNIQVGDIIVWNCRAKPMTEKPSDVSSRIQPLVYDKEKLVVSHNGVVANEDEPFEIDTELFARRYLDCGRQAKVALEKTVGGSAYLMVDLLREKIIVIRDFKPLAKAYVKGIGYFVMSDREGFRRIFGDMDIAVWEDFYYSDVQQFTVNEIDIGSGLIAQEEFEPLYRSYLPTPNSRNVLVMSSGGIDSSVSACLAKKHLGLDVTLVHFDLGQKAEPGEREAVQYLSEFLDCELKIIELPWLGDLGSSALTDPMIDIPKGKVRENLKSTICWTPARNLVMISCLMAVAEAMGASRILNGFSLEEEGSYPDNSLDFFRSLNTVSDFGTLTRPRVVMLESNLMKPEIVHIGRYFNLDFSRLWSCDMYNNSGECGWCGACTLKGLALDQEKTLHRSMDNLLARVNLEGVLV